ncbi:hypothetical protein CK203_040343 [Vitis vinifera]|uniref:Uncharacterized protein n=1 Tax=Vitis vinifera TaxID=29760 RepID=A0A438FX70_VITVI|nr:hypothetical protein CK203_040343 [Vitis vinifera]
MDARLLTLLAPKPLPQPIPPQFRMDLHCAYHQGSGHEIDHCITLRRTIQDLIDQGLVHLGHPSVTINPLPAHTSHVVLLLVSGIHFMDFTKPDDRIHMLSWDDSEPEPIVVDESYEVDGVILDPEASAPFRLVPDTPSIRVETSTSPKGLIHMLTADRATCIVLSTDNLSFPRGSDHTLPLYIFVCYYGHRVPFVLLDNGSALNVCPLAITVALGFGPLDFESSSQQFEPMTVHAKRFWSSEDTYSTSEPVLEISHGNDDLFLIGFTFDAIQAMEVEQFCRDHVHGSGEFIAIVDHDTPFSLGFVPTKANYKYMLSDGAPSTSTSVLVTLPFSDHMSLLTLYFPEETNEYGTSAEIADTIDEAILRDEYSDEMLMFVPAPGLLTTIAYDNDVYESVNSPVVHDSDEDSSFTSDSSLSDQEVSPTIGDSKIVDFGIADQPRELRIELDLSIDESDSLV